MAMNKMLKLVAVPHSLNKIDLSKYFFPESLLRSIEYTALSGFDNGKHLLLASPHPGSGVSMKKLSLFMAQKCGSDHYSVDYHWLIHSSKLLSKREVPKPLLGNSKPFSPSLYEQHSEEDVSDSENEEKPKMMLLTVNNDGGAQASEEPKKKECNSGTHYDTPLFKEDIDNIISGLKSSIKKRKSRAIISVSDITDMIGSTPRGSGEEFIFGLMEMANQLNAEGVETQIFAHSTPSLINSDNLSKPRTFYSDLFDGKVSLSDNGYEYSQENLWMDGSFFKTVLDGMKPNRFTKIPLAPPTPAYAFRQSQYDLLKAEHIFEKWLDVMEEDTRLGNSFFFEK